MKTLTINLEDTIYARLLVAGTKNYREEMPNPDYDPKIEGSTDTVPNIEQTRDEYLAGVVDTAIKNILKTHEVQEVSNKAVVKKQKEIEGLTIKTTIT